MSKYIQYSVNPNGIAQIAAFLKENHKKGEMISENADMLAAWAQDAEFQLSQGNPALFEIKSVDSIRGRTQEFTISSDGIDSEQIEVDE